MMLRQSSTGPQFPSWIMTPKCPAPFVSSDAFSCSMPCPADKQFTRQGDKCVYTPDPRYSVSLTKVGAALFNGSTLNELKLQNPLKAAELSAEQTRFKNAFELVWANIDKQKKVENAFRNLQLAENARDKAPVAYQQARTNYYTLLKGDTWKTDEKERVAKAEIDPEIRQFRNTLADIEHRTIQQRRTIDVMNGLKDKVLSIKNDFKYSTDTLQRQLTKIQDQVIFDRRKREDQSRDNKWELVDKVLNYIIIAVLLFAVWRIYKTYFSNPATASPPSPSAVV